MKGFGNNQARGASEGDADSPGTAASELDSTVADRIRLGLVGLSTIALIVFAASAGAKTDVRQATPSTGGETLSVLGVAPKLEKDKAREDGADAKTTLPPVETPEP